MDSSPGATPYSAPTGCPMRGERQTSLYGPEFASDPQRVYDAFRAHGLAAPIELAPGVEATLIVQHEAALRVLQNPPTSPGTRGGGRHCGRDAYRSTARSCP